MTVTGKVSADASWHAPHSTVERLAAALESTERTVAELLSSYIGRSGSGPVRLTGTEKVGVAVASALHREAGIALPVAAAIVRDQRKVCASVLATLDFIPPGGEGGGAERDPFLFFTAHAGEAHAVPAIDEFLDVMDGRRISWRRPRHDAYRLASELHRLTEATRTDDTPALQEEYMDLLASLRVPPPQLSEWIGTITGGVFRPAPDRFSEAFPALRQGLQGATDRSRFDDTYGTRVSVDISLAARCFKRRMLGLDVTDPFATRPPARPANEGVSVLQ